MSIEKLKGQLPEYAKDLKLNLSGMLNAPEGLSEEQLWGSILVAAIASRNGEVTQLIEAEASQHLSAQALHGVRAASAVMAMNNIYYRFTHLVSNPDYGKMPAKLRMNVMMNPGVDKVTFELWSLVVSAINGCGLCVDSHEKHLIEKGLSREAVQFAAKIAAVIHGIAVVLEYERTNVPAQAVSQN